MQGIEKPGWKRRRFGSVLFQLLLLGATALIAWLGSHDSQQWDWSDRQRSHLSGASERLLAKLDGPLTLTAFVRRDALLRQRVDELVQGYRRFKQDIDLSYINPDLHPEQARQLGITEPIEIELGYAGRRTRVKRLSEQSLSSAIQRLSQNRQPWIVGLEGQGERSLLGSANGDLGLFGNELRRQGFHIQPLDLTQVQVIPNNTAVLVIASPTGRLTPVEVDRIQGYIASGGNLLWLRDPGDEQGLEPLADNLGIDFLPGVVVDAGAGTLGLDSPEFAVISRYPEHPITRELKAPSLFPRAMALAIHDPGDWRVAPVLRTREHSWNETGPIKGEVARDPALGEQRGPLDIGLALTRSRATFAPGTEKHQQRLIVLGDGDFLSNAYLGNGSNLDLGLNILRWLSGEDAQLDIPVITTADRSLELSPRATAVIGLGSLLAAPAILLLIGLLVGWRRRRP